MRFFRQLFLLALALWVVSGCTRMPIHSESTVDHRPSVTFTLASDGNPADYQVFVDGLSVGLLSDYLAGQNALRVLSGPHLVRVEKAGDVVFEERIYLGDGATQNLIVH